MLFEEKIRLEKEKKIQQGYNSVSHAYETSQSSNSSNISFSTVPMGKPPPFDGTDYARWSEDMQVHLYGLNPHLWTVVCVGVPQLGEDEVATPEYEHDMFRNAQAVGVIRSSLCTMEYNKVEELLVQRRFGTPSRCHMKEMMKSRRERWIFSKESWKHLS